MRPHCTAKIFLITFNFHVKEIFLQREAIAIASCNDKVSGGVNFFVMFGPRTSHDRTDKLINVICVGACRNSRYRSANREQRPF